MNPSECVDIDRVVSGLQQAYAAASGMMPSSTENVQKKWRAIAHVVLHDEHIRTITDEKYLATVLHDAFIGVGHRTVLYERKEDDPILWGWRGSALYVITKRPYLAPTTH